jgi:pSer/pThr/pTyr-binding forkhead associated (FHA) protein
MDPLDAAILALRVALVLVLYLFLWLVVRGAIQALRTPPAPSLLEPRAPEPQPPAPTATANVLRLLVVDSGGAELRQGQVVVVEAGVTLGRSEHAGLVLADPAVSAEHARLERRDGRWVVRDLGSTNGTLLNQGVIDGEIALTPGDVLGLGNVRLEVVGR